MTQISKLLEKKLSHLKMFESVWILLWWNKYEPWEDKLLDFHQKVEGKSEVYINAQSKQTFSSKGT